MRWAFLTVPINCLKVPYKQTEKQQVFNQHLTFFVCVHTYSKDSNRCLNMPCCLDFFFGYFNCLPYCEILICFW